MEAGHVQADGGGHASERERTGFERMVAHGVSRWWRQVQADSGGRVRADLSGRERTRCEQTRSWTGVSKREAKRGLEDMKSDGG